MNGYLRSKCSSEQQLLNELAKLLAAKELASRKMADVLRALTFFYTSAVRGARIPQSLLSGLCSLLPQLKDKKESVLLKDEHQRIARIALCLLGRLIDQFEIHKRLQQEADIQSVDMAESVLSSFVTTLETAVMTPSGLLLPRQRATLRVYAQLCRVFGKREHLVSFIGTLLQQSPVLAEVIVDGKGKRGPAPGPAQFAAVAGACHALRFHTLKDEQVMSLDKLIQLAFSIPAGTGARHAASTLLGFLSTPLSEDKTSHAVTVAKAIEKYLIAARPRSFVSGDSLTSIQVLRICGHLLRSPVHNDTNVDSKLVNTPTEDGQLQSSEQSPSLQGFFVSNAVATQLLDYLVGVIQSVGGDNSAAKSSVSPAVVLVATEEALRGCSPEASIIKQSKWGSSCLFELVAAALLSMLPTQRDSCSTVTLHRVCRAVQLVAERLDATTLKLNASSGQSSSVPTYLTHLAVRIRELTEHSNAFVACEALRALVWLIPRYYDSARDEDGWSGIFLQLETLPFNRIQPERRAAIAWTLFRRGVSTPKAYGYSIETSLLSGCLWVVLAWFRVRPCGWHAALFTAIWHSALREDLSSLGDAVFFSINELLDYHCSPTEAAAEDCLVVKQTTLQFLSHRDGGVRYALRHDTWSRPLLLRLTKQALLETGTSQRMSARALSQLHKEAIDQGLNSLEQQLAATLSFIEKRSQRTRPTIVLPGKHEFPARDDPVAAFNASTSNFTTMESDSNRFNSFTAPVNALQTPASALVDWDSTDTTKIDQLPHGDTSKTSQDVAFDWGDSKDSETLPSHENHANALAGWGQEQPTEDRSAATNAFNEFLPTPTADWGDITTPPADSGGVSANTNAFGDFEGTAATNNDTFSTEWTATTSFTTGFEEQSKTTGDTSFVHFSESAQVDDTSFCSTTPDVKYSTATAITAVAATAAASGTSTNLTQETTFTANFDTPSKQIATEESFTDFGAPTESTTEGSGGAAHQLDDFGADAGSTVADAGAAEGVHFATETKSESTTEVSFTDFGAPTESTTEGSGGAAHQLDDFGADAGSTVADAGAAEGVHFATETKSESTTEVSFTDFGAPTESTTEGSGGAAHQLDDFGADAGSTVADAGAAEGVHFATETKSESTTEVSFTDFGAPTESTTEGSGGAAHQLDDFGADAGSTVADAGAAEGVHFATETKSESTTEVSFTDFGAPTESTTEGSGGAAHQLDDFGADAGSTVADAGAAEGVHFATETKSESTTEVSFTDFGAPTESTTEGSGGAAHQLDDFGADAGSTVADAGAAEGVHFATETKSESTTEVSFTDFGAPTESTTEGSGGAAHQLDDFGADAGSTVADAGAAEGVHFATETKSESTTEVSFTDFGAPTESTTEGSGGAAHQLDDFGADAGSTVADAGAAEGVHFATETKSESTTEVSFTDFGAPTESTTEGSGGAAHQLDDFGADAGSTVADAGAAEGVHFATETKSESTTEVSFTDFGAPTESTTEGSGGAAHQLDDFGADAGSTVADAGAAEGVHFATETKSESTTEVSFTDFGAPTESTTEGSGGAAHQLDDFGADAGSTVADAGAAEGVHFATETKSESTTEVSFTDFGAPTESTTEGSGGAAHQLDDFGADAGSTVADAGAAEGVHFATETKSESTTEVSFTDFGAPTESTTEGSGGAAHQLDDFGADAGSTVADAGAAEGVHFATETKSESTTEVSFTDFGAPTESTTEGSGGAAHQLDDFGADAGSTVADAGAAEGVHFATETKSESTTEVSFTDFGAPTESSTVTVTTYSVTCGADDFDDIFGEEVTHADLTHESSALSCSHQGTEKFEDEFDEIFADPQKQQPASEVSDGVVKEGFSGPDVPDAFLSSLSMDKGKEQSSFSSAEQQLSGTEVRTGTPASSFTFDDDGS